MTRNRIEQHPDEYREDLNPDYLAGENHGPRGMISRTAYDIKQLHQDWPQLDNEQLKQLPVLEEGERLDQGAVYFDLRRPERGPFKATGNMTAGPQNWYVPKIRVDHELWNRITGVQNPDRLGDLANR